MDDEVKYKVYIHRNMINGKVYIGITSKTLADRFRSGNGYHHNAHFKNAIKKYGWNNFEHVLIADGLSYDDACEMEQSLIKEYDSTNREKGYNISQGGDKVRLGIKHTEEAKQKMRDNHWSKRGKSKLLGTHLSQERIEKLKLRKGELASFYGKHHTEETKQKISESNSGEKGYWHNHEMSEEHRRHISEGQCKPILQILNGEVIAEFPSAKDAEEQTGIARYNISRCCCNHRKTAGGYEWRHKAS